MSKIKIILPILVLGLMTSCVARDPDPSKGGLFSYSPKTYNQRAAEREAILSAIEAEQKAELEQGTVLKEKRDDVASLVASQQLQLNAFESNIVALKDKLKDIKPNSDAGKGKLSALEERMMQIEQEASLAKQSVDVNARKLYLEKLNAEYASLEKDMQALLME